MLVLYAPIENYESPGGKLAHKFYERILTAAAKELGELCPSVLYYHKPEENFEENWKNIIKQE